MDLILRKHYRKNKNEINTLITNAYHTKCDNLTPEKQLYFYKTLKKYIISKHHLFKSQCSKHPIDIPDRILKEIVISAYNDTLFYFKDCEKRRNNLPKYYQLTDKEIINNKHHMYSNNSIEYFLFNLTYIPDNSQYHSDFVFRNSLYNYIRARIISVHSNKYFNKNRIQNINLVLQYISVLEYLFWANNKQFIENKTKELFDLYISTIFFESKDKDVRFEIYEIYEILYQSSISDCFFWNFESNIIRRFELFESLIIYLSKDYKKLCSEYNLLVPTFITNDDFKELK